MGTTGRSWTALKDLEVKTMGDFESRTPAWKVERKQLILTERIQEIVLVEFVGWRRKHLTSDKRKTVIIGRR